MPHPPPAALTWHYNPQDANTGLESGKHLGTWWSTTLSRMAIKHKLTGKHMLKRCPGWWCFQKSGPLPRKMQLLGASTPTCLYHYSLHMCEQTGEKGKLETSHLDCLHQAAGLFATIPYSLNYSPHPIMVGTELNNTCHIPGPSAFVPRFRVLPGSMMAPSKEKGGHRGCQKPRGDTHQAPHCLY